MIIAHRYWVSALMLALTLATGGVRAQSAEALPWHALSPAQQEVLERFQKRWSELASEQRLQLRAGAQKWLHMTPAEQVNAKQRFKQWQTLPPDQRERTRQGFAAYQIMPPEVRAVLREQAARFHALAPEQRKALRERWRSLPPAQRPRIIDSRQASPVAPKNVDSSQAESLLRED